MKQFFCKIRPFVNFVEYMEVCQVQAVGTLGHPPLGFSVVEAIHHFSNYNSPLNHLQEHRGIIMMRGKRQLSHFLKLFSTSFM